MLTPYNNESTPESVPRRQELEGVFGIQRQRSRLRAQMSSLSSSDWLSYNSVPLIRGAFAELTTEQLANPGAFEARIQSYLQGNLAVPERYADPTNQNLHMVRFHWGHDHDFGTFQVPGLMGTRHIWMLSRFFDHFGIDPNKLAGTDILDVGCWTGGVSLALAKLGARVTAIDEINKYVEALGFLTESFGLTGLQPRQLSLYELGEADVSEHFDMIFCLGVVYHLTDPIVGLRRLYHALKPGGLLLLESMAIDSDRALCEYAGPSQRNGIFGWNWFIPSPRALHQWLADTGFGEIQVGNGGEPLAVTDARDPMGPNRCFALARKQAGHILSRAGLSTNIA